jgi:hypothetical protein
MVHKRSSLVIAAIAALFSFLTVTYVSCDKTGGLVRCEGVICENGGFCQMDAVMHKPKCICPTGYEGNNCSVLSVAKYYGTWDMRQIIKGTDTAAFLNDTSYYMVNLKKSATPTTFFIDNFSGNPYYNSVTCTLDSFDSRNFTIDTFSAYHMLFDHYMMLYGSGTMTNNDSLITAKFAVRHLSPTANWINDTISLRMVPHKF